MNALATYAALDQLRAGHGEASALLAARDAVMPGGRDLGFLDAMEAQWCADDAIEAFAAEQQALAAE